MKTAPLFSIFLLSVLSTGFGSSKADQLFGVYRTVTIDSDTGRSTSSSSVLWNYVNSLAKDAEGRLFSVSQGQLVQIDPYALTLTPVLTLHGLGGFTGLAFSPTGDLFAVQRGPTRDDPLYRIDTLTGNVTVVGEIGFYRLSDIAYSPSGTLYGWSGLYGLITIDPETGQGTDVNPNLGAPVEIQALTFGDDGTLYGARDSLFKINPVTGVPVLIGGGGYSDIRGLAVIPEPGTVILMGLGLSGLLWLKLHQRKS